MAYLQLFPHDDREIDDLPYCCMRCGAPAAALVRQRFSTKHYFVTVEVPMCNKHRFHWRYSALLVVGLMGCLVLLQCGVLCLPALAESSGGSVGVVGAFA